MAAVTNVLDLLHTPLMSCSWSLYIPLNPPASGMLHLNLFLVVGCAALYCLLYTGCCMFTTVLDVGFLKFGFPFVRLMLLTQLNDDLLSLNWVMCDLAVMYMGLSMI